MYGVLALLILASVPAEVPSAGEGQSSTFDEPALPLTPKNPRTEEEEAGVTAAALYSHGRLLERREDYAGALRRYQRAWRYDPSFVSILPRIVFLAHRLKRTDEAARYAVLAAERTDVSPALLRQLALRLSQRQQWQRAIELFEKSLGPHESDQPDAGQADLATTIAYLEMGRLCFLLGDYAKSAEYFAHVQAVLEDPQRLAENPTLEKILLGQSVRTYRMLAESFLQAGRLDEAQSMVLKAAEDQQDDQEKALLEFHLARIAAKRGQKDVALEHLNAYFDSKSAAAGTAAYELLAEMLGADTEGDQTARERLASRINQLLEADSKNAPLLLYAAGLERDAERFEKAEQRLQSLLVFQPNLDVYHDLVDIYRHQGRVEDLIDVLQLALARGSGLQDFEELLHDVSSDEKLTAELIDRAEDKPEDDEGKASVGALLAGAVLTSEAGAADTADALLESAVQLLDASERASWLLDWGLKQLLTDRYEPAAAMFRQALKQEMPENRQAACRFYLVRSLALAGLTDEALKEAENGAAAFPDVPRMQAQPGWVLYYANRYEDAEKAYLALMKQFDPLHDSSDIREAVRDARLVLSNIGVQLERTAEAEEWLEQILDEFPEDIGALNDLGYLWAEQGKNLNRSLAMIRQAVEGDPDNEAYLDSLGWVFYRLERYTEAVEQLEKASSGDDPDAVILDHLGDALLETGRSRQAVAAWRRAVRSLRDDGEKSKRRAIQQKIKKHEK